MATGYFAARAVAGAVQGAGEGAQAFARAGEGEYGDAQRQFAEKLLGQIPLLGQLSKGLNDMVEAGTGYTAAVADAARHIQNVKTSTALTGQIEDARRGGAAQIAGVEMRRGDIHAEAASAQAIANQFAADPSRFVTRDVFGQSTSGMGSARLGLAGAQAGLQEAQAELSPRTAAVEQARAAVAAREQQLARISEDVRQNRAAAAGARNEANSATFVGEGLAAQRRLTGVAVTAEGKAAGSEKEFQEAQNQLLKERQALQDALGAQAEKIEAVERRKYEIAQAQIKLDKERLTVVNQQLSVAENIAGMIGGGEEGIGQDLLDAIKQAKSEGVKSLDDDQKELINQANPNWLKQQQIEAGKNAPEISQIQGEFFGAGNAFGVDQLRGQREELERAIAQLGVTATANLKTALDTSLAPIFDEMIRAFQASIETQVRNAISKVNSEKFEGAVQKQNAGG